MPETMINWFRVATLLSMLALMTMLVCQIMFISRGGSDVAIAVVVLTATVFWTGGVWLLTPSFQDESASSYGFGPRSALRPWVRWLQCGWIGAASVQVLAASLATPPAFLNVFTYLGTLVGAAGMVMLCLLMEQLAAWARDNRGGSALNLAIWALALAPLGTFLPAVGGPLGRFPIAGLILGNLPWVLWIVGIGLLLFAMFSLSQAVDYSIRHARELQAREVRRARRAARFSHQSGARARETTGYGG